MPVVKAQKSHHLQNSAIVMDLSDLEDQARNIVTQAKASAASILEEARASGNGEAQRLRDEAKRAGHDEGFKAGFEQGLAQGRQEALALHTPAITQLAERWQQTLTLFQGNLPSHLADARIDLVRLALAIAANVTRQEGLRNPGVIKANVEAALALVTTGRHVVLQIHPDEIATIEGYMPTLMATFKNVSGIELQPDAALEPGGCIARFGTGQVDARLETQVQRIADELLAKDG